MTLKIQYYLKKRSKNARLHFLKKSLLITHNIAMYYNKINSILFLSLVVLLFSCVKNEKTKSEIFFDKIFKSIHYNSIKKDALNWKIIEQKVKDSITVFNNAEDVFKALECTLHFIDDKHGFMARPEKNFLLNDSLSVPDVKTAIVGKNIGYIKINGFGANDSLSTKYALKIRKSLKDLDNSSNLSGWIIDLNDNNGGVDYSQLLGLSPLFKDSIIAYTKNNKGIFKEIICAGNYFKGSIGSVKRIDYDSTLKNKNKKIAVLMSSKTASLGELVSLALKTQGGTKIFGSESIGMTTGLKELKFTPVGAVLFYSDQYLCDSKKNIIKGSIMPDVQCEPEESLIKAIKWIETPK